MNVRALATNCDDLPIANDVCFGLTGDDGGWISSVSYAASWVSGSGWTSGNPSALDQVYIRILFGGTYRVIRTQVNLSAGITPDGAAFYSPGSNDPSGTPVIYNAPVPSYIAFDGTYDVDRICLGFENLGTSFWGYIQEVIITFAGDAPPIGSACA